MTLCVHQSQGLPVVLDDIIVYITQSYYICWRADLSRDALRCFVIFTGSKVSEDDTFDQINELHGEHTNVVNWCSCVDVLQSTETKEKWSFLVLCN